MLGVATAPDEQIVGQVLAGRREDFGVLVGRYLPVVHGVAFAQLRDRADAEDVSQETFLNAFKSLPQLRDRKKFGAWLLGIARHRCSRVRDDRRRRARLAEEADAFPATAQPDMADRDLRRIVREKVSELDEVSREALMLYYFSGKKIHEVAGLLEISPDAAAKRIQRAREALGEKLLDEIGPVARSKKSDEERQSRIMALILAMPVAWDPSPPKPAQHADITAAVTLVLKKLLSPWVIVPAVLGVVLSTALLVLQASNQVAISGSVTNGSRPANARVVLVSGRLSKQQVSALAEPPRVIVQGVGTNREGRFRFDAFRSGTYTVIAGESRHWSGGKGGDGFTPSRFASAIIEPGEDPQITVNLELPAAPGPGQTPPRASRLVRTGAVKGKNFKQ